VRVADLFNQKSRRWMPAWAGTTFVLLAACAAAAPPPVADTPYPDRPDPAEAAEFEEQLAYDIAESLVTEVGPRFAGSDGDRKAVEWALLKLTVLGFENVRAEPVTVPLWQRGEIAVELLGAAPRPLEAAALGGSVGTPAAGIEAEVVMVPTLAALEQLPAKKVKGRIVFISGRMERTRDGAAYNTLAPVRRTGPAVAARKGARAVLIRSLGTDAAGAPHTGTTKYGDGPKIPAAALAAAAADALEQALGKGAARVRMRLTARDAGTARSANVIGEIPGQTPEIVLLGAHLDSWDITPGANDDAAGVGIVIAAAHRLATLGKPRRTIRVVLFANEEFGASGAKTYAQAHADELMRHVLVMEADSGSGSPIQLDAWVDEADWPEVARLATELKLEPGKNAQEGGVDVGPLRKLGVPEIVVKQDTSRYYDVHHTRSDTVERLDRDGLARATDVFAAIARAASEREAPFARLPKAP
jgi:carboxypeptidase Q